MRKRLIATVLWFSVGWYAGATFAFFVGVSALLAPVVGVTAAVLVGVDPRHVIWHRRTEKPATTVRSEGRGVRRVEEVLLAREVRRGGGIGNS